MKDILPGRKSYIVSASIILTGVCAYLHGDLSLLAAVTQVLGGLGLSALRLGISSSKP